MITTFNVATLLSDTDMHSTGFPQFPMNVHEGLKDGPQPSFNLSILAQVILTRAQLITCLLS